MENITVNALELASELADQKLRADWSESITIDAGDGEEVFYTEEAQDLFNEYYDKYFTLINSCKA